MSNEIKYVNEAGVRRIVTDTRARLTDLTTDVNSAFGFSLDLSDIHVTASINPNIKFSLPKEFSSDEYDIYLKFILAPYYNIPGSIHFNNAGTVFNTGTNRIPANSFRPISEEKLIKFTPNDTTLHKIYLTTKSNISQVRFSGAISSGQYYRMNAGIYFALGMRYKFYAEDGQYILELSPGQFIASTPSTDGGSSDMYLNAVETHFSTSPGVALVSCSVGSVVGLDGVDNTKPTFTVSNIRVLLHKKLEATVE